MKTVTLKTKLLTKASAKGSLKGPKVKTTKVKVGAKKVTEKFVTKCKKIYAKKKAAGSYCEAAFRPLASA